MTNFTSRFKKTLKITAITVVWLAIWQLLSMHINEEILFVSPLSVILQLSKLCVTAQFWFAVFGSMTRVLGGFIIGYIIAALLAVTAHKFALFRSFISPIISIIKSTPVASFIILALMWTGKELVPVYICMLMVIPIVWSNMLSGLSDIDPRLSEVARLYRMPFLKRTRLIYLPSLYPYLMAASGSGLGLCWKAGIAAEVICRTIPSIGNNIWETKFYIETDKMFAWTATVIILSVLFDKLVSVISRNTIKRFDTEDEDVSIK